MDEVFIHARGKQHYLWRVVDQDGNVLDILVQSRILTIPVGTVRSRLSRGRGALRKLLDIEDHRSSAALPRAA
jgi:putative transposase